LTLKELNDLKKAVHKKRIESGLTAKTAAEQIGVSFSTYCKFQAGIVKPNEINTYKYKLWVEK
jgi:DNA-binding XRE family transcriptional regulator